MKSFFGSRDAQKCFKKSNQRMLDQAPVLRELFTSVKIKLSRGKKSQRDWCLSSSVHKWLTTTDVQNHKGSDNYCMAQLTLIKSSMSNACKKTKALNQSELKMDVEKSTMTVDCLRGRLLAERVASRNAKMEAEHLGNKLIELENLLRKEGKSRNRAEKKLKSLMKKLESNNISYYSSESGLLDRSDITSTSSLSSTASSKPEDKSSKNSQRKDFPVCSGEKIKFPIGFDNLKCIDSQTSMSSESHGSSPVTAKNCSSSEHYSKQGHHEIEGLQSPALRASTFPEVMNPMCHNSGRYSDLESNQNYNIASTDELCAKPSTEEEVNQENDEDEENHADDSLALVAVEKQETKQTIDPEVLGATVKEVLDALRHAKEQLQSSMERKRRSMNMIKVG